MAAIRVLNVSRVIVGVAATLWFAGMAHRAMAHDASQHAGHAQTPPVQPAHAMHEQHMHQQPAQDVSDVTVTLANDEVVDSTGKPLRFRSDVISDKAVAITFLYTTCTTICPPLAGIFESVQEELGGRLGKDIRLVTVSIDPTTDTPQRMAAMASRFHAGPGWLWITGTKDAVDQVLKGLGTYTPDIESHPPVVLVGAAGSQQWTRMYGFADPAEIAERTRQVADRLAGHAVHSSKEKM